MGGKPTDNPNGTAIQHLSQMPKKRKLNTVLINGKGPSTKPSNNEKGDFSERTTTTTNPFDSSRIRAQNANGNVEKVDIESCEFVALDLRPTVVINGRKLEIEANSRTKKMLVETAPILPKLKVDFEEVGLPTSRRVAVVEVENLESAGQKVAKVTLRSAANHPVWFTSLPVSIVGLCANQYWVVVTSAGGQMNTYATESGVLQCSLRLQSPAVFLSLADQMCAVVDEKADISTWNLRQMKQIKSQPLSPLILESSGRITGCALTSDGIPIIYLDNGEVWFESVRWNSWKQIETCSNALTQLKTYLQSIKTVVPNGLIGRIVINDKKTKQASDHDSFVAEMAEEQQLELLMQTMIELRSPVEFVLLSSLYANLIISRGKVHKLKTFMEFLDNVDLNAQIDTKRVRDEVGQLLAENPGVAKNYESIASGQELVVEECEDFAFL